MFGEASGAHAGRRTDAEVLRPHCCRLRLLCYVGGVLRRQAPVAGDAKVALGILSAIDERYQVLKRPTFNIPSLPPVNQALPSPLEEFLRRMGAPTAGQIGG
jgi:hypothetical protein